MSSLYYLFLILNEKKNEFVINRNEPLFLAVLLMSAISLKFTLILGICIFCSIQWQQEEKTVPVKVILIPAYLILLLQNSVFIPEIGFVILLFIILTSFIFSLNKKIEIYIIPLLVSLTLHLRPHITSWVIILYIGTFIMYLKYKLTKSNLDYINSFFLKYFYIEKYLILMRMKSNKCLRFSSNSKRLESSKKTCKKSKTLEHLSDGKRTYIYLFSLILLSIVMGVLK